jgi:hypothetical protein
LIVVIPTTHLTTTTDSFIAVAVLKSFHSINNPDNVFVDTHKGIKKGAHGSGDAPT